MAGAASVLTAAYFMLRHETDYHDLGGRLPRAPRRRAASNSASFGVCGTSAWTSK